MRKFLVITGLAALSLAGLAACTGGTVANNGANSAPNRNTGVVTNASNNSSSNNSNGSSAGNAVNSVANAVTGQVTEGDFFNRAADGGMAEVELSKAALPKLANAELKKFAQMMITDHTKANTELKELAGKKKIALPTEMGSSHKASLDKLSGMAAGPDFDKQYVSDMVSGHDSTVSLFESVANNTAADAETKAWAAKTLPKLKEHQTMIKDIQSKMK